MSMKDTPAPFREFLIYNFVKLLEALTDVLSL